MKTQMTNAQATAIAAGLVAGDTTALHDWLWVNPDAPAGAGTWRASLEDLHHLYAQLRTGERIDSAPASVFVAGNSKLPFSAFSSMPIVDCAGYGDCGRFCYSLRALRYPSAFKRMVSNSLLLRYESGRRFIGEQFAKLPAGVLRLYVDGDFPDKETLVFWMDLLKTRPDVKAYGYSKSWIEFLSVQLSGYDWPENYALNLSSGSRHSESMRQIMSQLPIVRGEFIAVKVDKRHITSRAYQSRENTGHREYSRDVIAAAKSSGRKRVFTCAGKCGACLPDGGHACGSSRFSGVAIAIGVH